MTIPYVEPYYRVHVSVGPYSWDIERGDPADYGPIDGLKIGWKYPENAAWPTQPELPYASFGVIVPDTDSFEGVDVGAPVTIAVWAEPAGTPLPADFRDNSDAYLGVPGLFMPVASFGGRVTEMTGEPHELGYVYRLQCIDYLVDALDLKISDEDGDGWPAEDILDRLTRLAELGSAVTGGGVPWTSGAPSDGWGVFHAQAEPETKGVLEHMTDHLSQYADNWHSDTLRPGSRGIVHSNNHLKLWQADTLGLEPDPARRLMIVWRARKMYARSYRMPARFTPTGIGGLWRPEVDPYDGTGFVDPVFWPAGEDTAPERFGSLPADLVEFDATWSRTKRARAERVWVETNIVFVDAGTQRRVYRQIRPEDHTSTPPPSITITTTLAYREEARWLAEFLLPEAGVNGRWEVDKFRFWADQDPYRLTRGNEATWLHPYWAVAFNPVVAIAGIPPEQNPNSSGADYYAGVLTGCEFVLQNGRYYVDFTLGRDIPRPNDGGTSEGNTPHLTSASMKLDPAQAAVRGVDLDPGYTFWDYRLLRKG